MLLNDKFYNILKWLVLLALPAAATLYNVLAGLWGLPYATEISQTILAIAAFLGALIGISTAEYNKVHADEIMTFFEDGEDNG